MTLTAGVTDDGTPVPNAPVTFAATGPGPAAPPGAAAVTGTDGRTDFTFTAAVAGDYTLSASATNAGETSSATSTVTFTPASGATMVLEGPTRAQTEEDVTVIATFINAGDPVPAAQVDFAVAGPGQATPAAGSAVTGFDGRAAFTFVADRAGDYTVTASASHLGEEASAYLDSGARQVDSVA